jgi:hypothetical protein
MGIRNRRGGLLLDLVLVIGIVLLAAFVLDMVGINFGMILSGAERFFGM